MNLILTEKKDAAKMIAAALGVPVTDKGGYFVSPQHTITWAQGHLVETCPPEYYDESYKKWSLDHLPIMPERLATRPMAAHRAKIGQIRKLIKTAGTIINACDCGQEGEMIARLIFEHAGYNKPHKRLWFNSLLKTEIKRAFADLKNSSDYDYLYDCARLRSYVDWTFGYNLTRAFTLKFADRFVVNAGRVTTPTLTEIVERELAINHFITENYQVLVFDHAGFRFVSKPLDAAVTAAEKYQSATITHAEKKEVSTRAPRLFSLNTLQKEANRIFGLKADQTLSIAENLYLKGLITYPRTDSEYLPDNYSESDIRAVFEYHRQPLELTYANKNIFNTKKVTDHHAIVPTTRFKDPDSKQDALLFDLILKRFFAAFAPDCLSLSYAIEAVSSGITFTAKKSVITDLGFKSIFNFKASDKQTEGEDEDMSTGSEIILPEIGACIGIDPAIDKRTTKPPARYTDASLISFMENAGRVINEKLKAGIGTVATRAQIIKKLETNKFINYKGKQIAATDKAIQIIGAIPFDLIKKPYLTLELEGLFDQIINHTASVEACQSLSNAKLKSLFDEISKLEGNSGNAGLKNATDLNCPVCSEPLNSGKYSVYCQSKAHQFSLPHLICNQKLTPEDHKVLLEGKKTRLIKKMTAKSGKSFSARLFLNPETFNIEFNFEAGK
ncbi:topoisomerase C-terminal repeat-containing protein [bacterium]|nr:topoisomerase C-terminal repeat-containing protein [bacterium]